MNSLSLKNIRSQLEESLPSLDQRILVKEIGNLSQRLVEMDGTLVKRLIEILGNSAAFRFRIYSQFQELLLTLPKLRTARERTQQMMGFLGELVPEKALGDYSKAFDRWMDITGVRELARVAMHASDRTSEMVLHLLKKCLVEEFLTLPAPDMVRLWEEQDVARHLEIELNDSPRWQNQVTVLKVWETLCATLPEEKWRFLWNDTWDRCVKNLLSSPEENIWLQIQAFKVCVIVEPSHGLAMIHHRLVSPASNRDDVFLRASLLDIVHESYSIQELSRLLQEIIRRPDPSEHVLITAVQKLALINAPANLPMLADVLRDRTDSVATDKIRATAAITLESTLLRALSDGVSRQCLKEIESIQETALKNATGYRFQLALIEGLGKVAKTHATLNPADNIDEFDHRILQLLDHSISNEQYEVRVRRVASEIREDIILNRIPEARFLYEKIISEGLKTHPGNSFVIPAESVPNQAILGRVLARISVRDYGYYAHSGHRVYQISRGEIFKRKLWRLLHEFNHPDPAKRQGYVHTVGRSYPGIIRAHARYLAETTETKVPGERLFFQKEYSWRPFIPTVDDVLSTTQTRNAGKTIEIYSSEGCLFLSGPKSFPDRFSLWWYITLNYGNIVQKRNYDLEDVQSGHSRNFIQLLLEDFGFSIEFHPHSYSFGDRTHQVIDPDIAVHLYPLIRNQLEWRPLS